MRLTINDATKEELLTYFFTPDGFGGGTRLGADKERFLIWLSRRRANALIDAQKQTIEASQKALSEYIEYVKQANAEKDIDRKLELFEKANAAYTRYERANKKYDDLDKKVNDALELPERG